MSRPGDSVTGWGEIFSACWLSSSSSAVNDGLMEYQRTNAGFTAALQPTGLELQITSALSAGGYADRISMRPRHVADWLTADFEVLCKFTSIAGGGVEMFLEIGIGGESENDSRDSNYNFIEVNYLGNQLRLWRMAAATPTNLQNAAVTWTAAEWAFRWIRIGPRFVARAWATAGPEPADWPIDFVDTTPPVPQAGAIAIALNGGNSGAVTWTQLVKEVTIWSQPAKAFLARAAM